MTCVHVVTDGAAALPSGATDDFGIVVVGGRLSIAGAEFDLPCADVSDLLAETVGTETAPRWIPADADVFRVRFEEVLGWGVEIVSLHAPSTVGGAGDAALAAAHGMGVARPISVVRSPMTAAGLGLIAGRLAALGLDQAPRGDLVSLAEFMGGAISMFGVGDSQAAAARAAGASVDAAAGGAEARPLMEFAGGRWQVVDWLPDTGAGLRALAERVTAAAQLTETGLHVGLMGVAADAEAAALATFLESRAFPSELWIAPADAPTAAILGPGGFGVAWYADPA